jgi:phosphate transport system substrate-binding protein
MGHWIQDFRQAKPNVEINYQSIGSGGGIEQVRAGTVDFGATDAPMSDQDLTAMPPVLQIPESAGPVCVTYNLPGLSKPLHLSAQALSGIFLGKITSWQDPILAGDNAGVALPNEKITVVHRAESSGTTNAFTEYLASVNPEWAKKVGAGKAVSWPTGMGGKGNEGVTGQIKQTPGSIGYVELAYAIENKLPVAAIQNQAGDYVLPTAASATAAIAAFAAALQKDLRSPIVNPPAGAASAYPISTLTFLIVPRDGSNLQKRTALKQFLQYIVGPGQAAAASLNYSPLPAAIRQQDLDIIRQMTTQGGVMP